MPVYCFLSSAMNELPMVASKSTSWLGQQISSSLACACLLSRFSNVQFFVTPWTVDFQDPLSMGFSQQEYQSGLPCPPPRDLPDPGIKLMSPALLVDSLPFETIGKPFYHYKMLNIFPASIEMII